MKIYPDKLPEGQKPNLSAQKVARQEVKVAPAPAAQSSPTDKVEISENGKKVAELMAQVNQVPDVRAEKVKALKEAVEAGTYRVSSLDIARKMLEEL
jgi:negative regulator of flagellin synthesis FlgM